VRFHKIDLIVNQCSISAISDNAACADPKLCVQVIIPF